MDESKPRNPRLTQSGVVVMQDTHMAYHQQLADDDKPTGTRAERRRAMRKEAKGLATNDLTGLRRERREQARLLVREG